MSDILYADNFRDSLDLHQRKVWDSIVLPKLKSSGFNLGVARRHLESASKTMSRRVKENILSLVERYEEGKKSFDGRHRYAATHTTASLS